MSGLYRLWLKATTGRAECHHTDRSL